MLMRLSQVHDTRHQGRIAQQIQLARQKGRVAWVGEGCAYSGSLSKPHQSQHPSGFAVLRVRELLGQTECIAARVSRVGKGVTRLR
jgi:hypothetical protein